MKIFSIVSMITHLIRKISLFFMKEADSLSQIHPTRCWILNALLLVIILPLDLKGQDFQLVEKYLSSLQPKPQYQFNSAMAEIASKLNESKNDLQKFQLLDERTRLLEKTLPERKLNEWVGRITKLGISKEGDAFLSIQLSGSLLGGVEDRKGVEGSKPSGVKQRGLSSGSVIFLTREERLSDLDDKSLIPAGTALFNLLKGFQSGDEVRFNAQLLPEMKTFVRELDQVMNARLLNPRFISRFEYLEKIEIPESRQSTLKKPKNASLTGKSSGDKKLSKIGKAKPAIQETDLLALLPKIDLHLFNGYRLSHYDWDYAPFMDRWLRQMRINLQNDPPPDYLSGNFPEGGRVTVQLELKREGKIANSFIHSVGSVSSLMRNHFERAVLSYELPKLPDNFKHSNLRVGFFHEFPPLPHLLFIQKGQKRIPGNASVEAGKKMNAFDEASAKINQRLQRKIKVKQTLKLYHYQLKKRIEEKIHVFQNFSKNERMLIKLQVTRPVSNTFWEILEEPATSAFRLTLINALERTKIPPLPKLLQDREAHKVLLDIRP